jgi:NitT/TauT family transport system permease protein
MTIDAKARILPVVCVVAALLVVWYALVPVMNAPIAKQRAENAGQTLDLGALIAATMREERPILPAPHQIAAELWSSTIDVPLTSRRNLLLHAWTTFAAALLGFAIGALFGTALAVLLVHSEMSNLTLMPWIVASQTVPTLALAPMVIVVLGSLGFAGILPKAIIAAYLCFFPVVIGVAKGLASPDALQRDLMRTWAATQPQVLAYLRLPVAVPYLFASLKTAFAAAIVGTIVAELPTGAQAGIGARLLAGSYYGQTIQIWAALVAAVITAAAAVAFIGLCERFTARAMGAPS